MTTFQSREELRRKRELRDHLSGSLQRTPEVSKKDTYDRPVIALTWPSKFRTTASVARSHKKTLPSRKPAAINRPVQSKRAITAPESSVARTVDGRFCVSKGSVVLNDELRKSNYSGLLSKLTQQRNVHGCPQSGELQWARIEPRVILYEPSLLLVALFSFRKAISLVLRIASKSNRSPCLMVIVECRWTRQGNPLDAVHGYSARVIDFQVINAIISDYSRNCRFPRQALT